ncbi:gamma-glutamylcyclotransferase [Coregonus clupeaformis]|uniref:gamma-glutamylcyclotransferase n=1 Tax=Coregonus clupeaformis TaxID=59861 RepID=UPI001BDF9438|nr:gamma-glutamylcyclotransferase [Coregonus clupeaformis]
MSYLTYTILLALLHQQIASKAVPDTAENNGTSVSNTSVTDHFMYFAYGSNLLKERLQLKNPSAVFVTTGSLKDHVIQFGYWKKELLNNTNSWHGGVATIKESKGDVVWGVVWKMDKDNRISLDRQEGVGIGFYSPLDVTINTDEGEVLCRTYQMNNFTAHQTSPPYKQVVCLGAKQNGLPLDYIKKLEAVETNGYSGPSILDDITILKPAGKGKSLLMVPEERR